MRRTISSSAIYVSLAMIAAIYSSLVLLAIIGDLEAQPATLIARQSDIEALFTDISSYVKVLSNKTFENYEYSIVRVRVDIPQISERIDVYGYLYKPLFTAKPPLVLLIHDFGSTHRELIDIAFELLSRNVAVLLVDLPGHGLSNLSIDFMKNLNRYDNIYQNTLFLSYVATYSLLDKISSSYAFSKYVVVGLGQASYISFYIGALHTRVQAAIAVNVVPTLQCNIYRGVYGGLLYATKNLGMYVKNISLLDPMSVIVHNLNKTYIVIQSISSNRVSASCLNLLKNILGQNLRFDVVYPESNLKPAAIKEILRIVGKEYFIDVEPLEYSSMFVSMCKCSYSFVRPAIPGSLYGRSGTIVLTFMPTEIVFVSTVSPYINRAEVIIHGFGESLAFLPLALAYLLFYTRMFITSRRGWVLAFITLFAAMVLPSIPMISVENSIDYSMFEVLELFVDEPTTVCIVMILFEVYILLMVLVVATRSRTITFLLLSLATIVMMYEDLLLHRIAMQNLDTIAASIGRPIHYSFNPIEVFILLISVALWISKVL